MLDCRAIESEIAGHAAWAAGAVRGLVRSIGQGGPVVSRAEPGRLVWEMAAPRATHPAVLRCELDNMAHDFKATAVADAIELGGRVARMADAGWWKRSVRRVLRRENETIEHAAGHIRRKGQCYASDHACKTVLERSKANRATLEGMEVCNADGDAFNLLEIADASMSNPKLRRAELMMRCRGFEEAAAYQGDKAFLLTLTCPRRFHRFNAAGKNNPVWTGATPKDGQEYLCATWAKVRAAWGRKGFKPYGFRVAEPHHDGCPHWHILLFMPPEIAGWFKPLRLVAGRKDHGAGAIGIMGAYAMKDSPQEINFKNANARFDVKEIDHRGATGYIAKYIAKNIDGLKETGENVGLDLDSGKATTEASVRVRVWASTWGIRQFQQVGGPSVTVWRELRRMRDEIEQPIQAAFDWESYRAAADGSQWALFWMLQGGPETARKDLSLKPFYVEQDESGKYGDTVKRVHGVQGTDSGMDYMLQTRLHEWTVQRAGLAAVDAGQAEFRDYMDVQKAINKFVQEAGFADVREFNARAAGAWTGVNNCTPSKFEGFDFSDFPSVEAWAVPDGGISRRADHQTQLEEVDFLCNQLQQQNEQPDYLNWRAKFAITSSSPTTSPRLSS